MANQSKLKAWVRYDGSGRVISGGPIFQVNKPKVGNWRQIDANLCCNSIPTTTTTTTAGGGGNTPTAWVGYLSTSTYNSCNEIGGSTTVLYTSTPTIEIGTFFYVDAALTQVYPGTLSPFKIGTSAYSIYGFGQGPLIGSVNYIWNCNNFPTTTSTTTAGLFTISAYYQGGSTTSQLCPLGSTGSGTVTLYSNTPTIQSGSMLYSSPGNPLTFGGFYYKQVGQNGVFYAPADNGVAVQYNCIYNYDLKSGSTQFSVCSGSVNLILYGNSPTLGIGQQLYTDNTLTTPYNPGSPILIGFGAGVDDPVWQVNSTGQITSQFGAC